MCSVAIIIAESSGRMLAILEHKNLPRPRKDGKGMCKGKPRPWDFPGGKCKDEDADERAVMTRELWEETGIDADSLSRLSEARFDVPEAKCAVFAIVVDQEFSVRAGEGVKETAWVDRAQISATGTYRMQRALAVSSVFVEESTIGTEDDDVFSVFESK